MANCGTKAVFTTIPCNGAAVSWTVSPSISGTTGDNTSTFTIPDNAPAGTYTITVEFRCGNKVLKNSIKFIITEVKNCTSDFNFIVTKNSDGSVNISTVPNMLIAGQEHWWGIQYNGAFPNCTACASIPFNFAVTSPVSGITYTWDFGENVNAGTVGNGFTVNGPITSVSGVERIILTV